ncbi:MAG: cation:proton antiporter [Gemmatimonadetes bacterium]|nr:cation:proton antiporter [Gemmatimonadota bacterium]
MNGIAVTSELAYVLLIFALFVVPKALQRYRLPSAVTSLVLGAIASIGLHLFTHEPIVDQFATLGIVSLFLFAGLEVDFGELRRESRVLVWHLSIQLGLLALMTAALIALLPLTGRAAALVALALLTPSTGFILDSLDGFGLNGRERFWVKSKAISTELVALGVMFVVLQGGDPQRLGISVLTLAGLVVLVPVAFQIFARSILPVAPKSEFAFLVIVALTCALVTRRLGVYYLVGAFLVGVAAQRFRRELPALASEKMLHAVEVFASFFVPFYFFKAGLHLEQRDLTWLSLGAGVTLLLVAVPLRVATVAVLRRTALREQWREALRVSTPLLPTLVFTLVIAEILREQFELPSWLFGALVCYTVLNTLIPGMVLHAPTTDPDVLNAAEEQDRPEGTEPEPAHDA